MKEKKKKRKKKSTHSRERFLDGHIFLFFSSCYLATEEKKIKRHAREMFVENESQSPFGDATIVICAPLKKINHRKTIDLSQKNDREKLEQQNESKSQARFFYRRYANNFTTLRHQSFAWRFCTYM